MPPLRVVAAPPSGRDIARLRLAVIDRCAADGLRRRLSDSRVTLLPMFLFAASSTLIHMVCICRRYSVYGRSRTADDGCALMAAPAYSFLRVMVQTRSRGHHALAATAYRFAMDVTAGDGREWNYARRGGVAASGAALPDGAANRWENPVLWAGEIERSEHRKDSRLFRDDVIGVPLELVAAGKAYEAIGEYARKISQLRRTPVHFAMHCPPRSDSSNWHAHVVYAGRQLTADGRSFSPKRDRAQDREELIDRHKAIWTAVCAEYGVELDFSGPVSEQPLAHLGPQAAGIERTAAHRETTDRLVGAIRAAGGEVSDARELSSVAHAAHAGESVTDLVMREGGPATTVGQRAKRPKPSRREVHEHPWIQLGKWSIPAPGPDEFDGVPEPAYTLALAAERPRPRPAAVVEAPLVAASELPRMPPAPVRAATRPRPRPAAVVEAPLVAASELPRMPPVPRGGGRGAARCGVAAPAHGAGAGPGGRGAVRCGVAAPAHAAVRCGVAAPAHGAGAGPVGDAAKAPSRGGGRGAARCGVGAPAPAAGSGPVGDAAKAPSRGGGRGAARCGVGAPAHAAGAGPGGDAAEAPSRGGGRGAARCGVGAPAPAAGWSGPGGDAAEAPSRGGGRGAARCGVGAPAPAAGSGPGGDAAEAPSRGGGRGAARCGVGAPARCRRFRSGRRRGQGPVPRRWSRRRSLRRRSSRACRRFRSGR